MTREQELEKAIIDLLRAIDSPPHILRELQVIEGICDPDKNAISRARKLVEEAK